MAVHEAVLDSLVMVFPLVSCIRFIPKPSAIQILNARVVVFPPSQPPETIDFLVNCWCLWRLGEIKLCFWHKGLEVSLKQPEERTQHVCSVVLIVICIYLGYKLIR